MEVISAMSDGASFEAARAIVIYSRRAGDQKVAARPWDYDYDEDDEEEANTPRQAFATVHQVTVSEDSGAVIGPGACLPRVEMEKLLRSLVHENTLVRKVLPSYVLCADSGCLAWYKPAHVAPIYFAARDDKFTRRLNAKRVLHPTLFLVAVPGSLSVFALAESDRPTDDTPVYVAPYFNLYDRGSMCRGNALYPPDVAPDRITAWEEAFFRTQFTHSNYATAKLTQHPGGHDGLWEVLLQLGGAITAGKVEVRFPADYLSPFPLRFAKTGVSGATDKACTVRDVLNVVRQGED